MSKPASAKPIADRPKAPLGHNLAFNGFFLFGMLTLHAFQLLGAPLLLSQATGPLFWAFQAHVERQFAVLLAFICRYFGPTKIRLTAEGDLDLKKIVKRDNNGKVIGIALPSRSVYLGNHQVYLDWLYAWVLLYNANLHEAVVIILKATLKWVPVVGPAMQFFGFIFLARKWEDDKLTLSAKLLSMAKRARERADPLVLMIFPEGTLVSRNTRPTSKKYADKAGIPDMRHCLLPRSTGLLYCLRGLAKGIPDLKLLDTTMAYEGIPADGYGQDYYTLQSVFGANCPPPHIHVHLRQFDVNGGVPIGDVHSEKGALGAADASEAERVAFDEWLRARWTEKDEQLGRFYSTGKLSETEFIDLDAAPRRDGDVVVLLGTMLAGIIGWRYVFALLWRVYRLVF